MLEIKFEDDPLTVMNEGIALQSSLVGIVFWGVFWGFFCRENTLHKKCRILFHIL